MKAVLLQTYGDVDQFQVQDVPTPGAGPGEVLVKLKASAVNAIDPALRQGFMAKFVPLELPAILGIDGAGTVAAVGQDVTGFAVGDRVIIRVMPKGHGTHADYAVAPVSGVAKLPDAVSFEAGVALPHVGLTGRRAVDMLGVGPGDRVLVSGALGGVGRAAVQYLKELGATPVAGVKSEQLAEARQLVGEVIDLSESPVSPGFDFAVSAAQPAAGQVVQHVRDGGRIASPVQTPQGVNADNRVTIEMVMAQNDPAKLQALADAAGRGELAIPVAQTFPLEQLGEAHRAFAAGAHGKVVLRH